MFGKFKGLNISFGKLEYVVDTKTFEEYLKRELQTTLENNLEACVDLDISYKGETHNLNIWNFAASSSKDEQEKGLSVSYDDNEFNSIDNLLTNADISNTKIGNIPDYFVIKLNDMDSDFLNEYKENHPDLNPDDYR